MNKIESTMKLFANKNRLRILKMLEDKNMCVCEITAVLGIKQPSVTAHLTKLKNAGVISEKQKGLYTEFFIKHKNPSAAIWKELSRILDNEPQVKKDLFQSRRTDRYSVCKK